MSWLNFAFRADFARKDTEHWLNWWDLSLYGVESHFETVVLIEKFMDVRSRNAVKEKYLAWPPAQPVIKEVICRKRLAEQFRQVW